ncbi:MAG: hypothetical protein ACFCVE_04460 [Phycisphaerae bacterium]
MPPPRHATPPRRSTRRAPPAPRRPGRSGSGTTPSPFGLAPLHITSRRLYRFEDTLEQEVSFGPIGIDRPARLIFERDESDGCFSIVARLTRGEIELPDVLLDRLGYLGLMLIEDLIDEIGGESGWWQMVDCSALVRHHFEPADARRILAEFRRLTPEEFTARNACGTADGDFVR